jgi:hypothetical protein
MLRILSMALLLLIPVVGYSGQHSGKTKESAPRVIDFEDDTIQGDLTQPDGEYVEARKKVEHTNLIRIREEFKDKVLQSVSDL